MRRGPHTRSELAETCLRVCALAFILLFLVVAGMLLSLGANAGRPTPRSGGNAETQHVSATRP